MAGRKRIPHSPLHLSPAQLPPPRKGHRTFLESGLLHGEGRLQSAEPVQADGGPQWASAAGTEGPGWAGELAGECKEEGCVLTGAQGSFCPWALPQLPSYPARVSLSYQPWTGGFQRTTNSLPAANCTLFCSADVWGLLLLSVSTQQRLLRHWRDIPLLLLPTAEGEVPALRGGVASVAGQRSQDPRGPQLHPCAFHRGRQQGSGRQSSPLGPPIFVFFKKSSPWLV